MKNSGAQEPSDRARTVRRRSRYVPALPEERYCATRDATSGTVFDMVAQSASELVLVESPGTSARLCRPLDEARPPRTKDGASGQQPQYLRPAAPPEAPSRAGGTTRRLYTAWAAAVQLTLHIRPLSAHREELCERAAWGRVPASMPPGNSTICEGHTLGGASSEVGPRGRRRASDVGSVPPGCLRGRPAAPAVRTRCTAVGSG